MRPGRKRFTGGLNVFLFDPVISSAIFDYSLFNAATTAGWDGIKPLYSTISITSTGSVRSINAGGPALNVGVMPVGSIIRLNIASGGLVIGPPGLGGAGAGANTAGPANGFSGGTGGTALLLQYPVSIENFGVVGGGGGGGGGGGSAANTGVGPAIYAAGGTGGGFNGAPGAGQRVDSGGFFAQGGPGGIQGNNGSTGSFNGGSGWGGTGGAFGAQGPAVQGIANVTYINRGSIFGPEI